MGGLTAEHQGQSGGSGPEPEILDNYLGDIRDTPILSDDHQGELCRAMSQSERSLRQAVVQIPETARLLVREWRDRQERGLVSGAMSHSHRDGSDTDWSRVIDEKLSIVQSTLARFEKARKAGSSRARQASLRSELADQIHEAHIALPRLVSILEMLPECADPDEVGGPEEQAEIMSAAREALARLTDSKNRFITHNLRLVVRCAKNYRGQGVSFLDLIQEGNLGLVRAVEKFDYDRGYKFSTYAVWWIEQALVRAVANNSRIVRVPSPILDKQRKLKQVEREIRTSCIPEPSEFDLASSVVESHQEIDDLRRSLTAEVSCEAPIGGAETLTVGETLTSDDVPDPNEAFDHQALQRALQLLLPVLSDRERDVIEWRYGLRGGQPRTLAEIGKQIGVSRERVRQIEKQALVALRENSEAREVALEMGLH